jgi:hypothetical protein
VIRVEPLRPAEDEAWDDFLLHHDGGLVYHSSRYRDLLLDELGCEAEYLVAREGDEIRGVMPMMWAEDGGTRVLNSMPFYGSHGGPVADSPDCERALAEAWNERATDPATSAATLVGNPFLAREPPPVEHNLTDERISQVTPLPSEASEDAIMGVIRSEARRNVRKAKRLGVTVERDEQALDELYRIHAENMEAIGGLAKSERFFEALPRHLRPGEDYDNWLARLDGEVVAALLVLRFNGVVEYFTSGTAHEHRTDNPHAVLLLEALLDSIRRGFRKWNWGGTWTSQTGVYRFKRKWGSEERPYRYFVQLNDRSLTEATPDQLLERFRHFYVLPFSELRSEAGAR